ncbi:DUF7253 family protein [Romboutsia sp.]|uniref:DUF7253 family protein n=1 Tax=Romboutsia sp. TaxID=1965302 RepID=UPI002B9D8E68|nr:hypothetical protein [Romboutsia sp.]HSQ89983.1 hypothetical protein [Romboutsia sp.]
MAKFAGKIGFSNTIETSPGVWSNEVIEKTYVGDVLKTSLRYQNDLQINDNVILSERISIIADIFVNNNIQNIKYVIHMGAKWAVTEFDVRYPRIILTLGGVYNG